MRVSCTSYAFPPNQAVEPQATAARVLPGEGLVQHDFLYEDESKERGVFIIKKSQVVWYYGDPAGKGKISAQHESKHNLVHDEGQSAIAMV